VSGRHRRPEPDPLPEVDLAQRLGAAPTVQAEAQPLPPRARHASAATDQVAASPAPAEILRPPAGAETGGAPAGSAVAVSGTTVVARRSRRAEREARRRAARQRVLVVGGGVLGVVLVGIGLWLLLRPGPETPGGSTAHPAAQDVTLVQLTGTDGTAAASAIVGTTESTDSAVALLVPSRLDVDVAGSGAMPFGETATLPGGAASADALTDLLGLRVDDTWRLSKPALAKLVDAVGGVQAAVDRDVVTTAADGTETVVVRAGNQLLKGTAAADYASFLADGEPEQARLARFDDVLTALLAKLPEDATGIGAFLGTTGADASASVDDAVLAKRLAVMRAAAADGSFVSDVLPVNEIDTGGPTLSYGLNAGDAAASLRAKFPGALQRSPVGVVRVLVENGVGTPGLVEQARAKLVDAGFRFVNGGNASSFTQDPSSIQVSDGTEESVTKGRQVAAALGLPADSVVPNDRGQTLQT
jgi:anionic cell wall polymer biosynthesis LytR-Cps2A-Psr (LCP) family protein